MYFLHIFHCRLSKLCASRNRDKLYTACLVHGLSCLLTITAADCCLTVTTTRPISSITMEEGMKSDITDLQVSPDGQVVFLLDQGLGNISRVELPTGNCRSFGRDLSCKYWICYNLLSMQIYFQDEAAGLTFSADCVLLHHSYRTTVMTSMGLIIKTLERKHYCCEAISSSSYLIIKRYNLFL